MSQSSIAAKPRTAWRFATLPLVALAMPALAQSVPPNSPAGSGSGATLSTQAPPGIRPPRSQSRPAEAVPGGQTAPQNLPQAIRWTEDWSKPVAADALLIDRIKHIALAGRDDVYLTLGGEERIYYADWHHAALGRTPNDSNDLVQSRLRLLADLHAGPNIRGFFELGDNREFGAEYPTPPNRDKFDISQAFVDITVPLGKAGKITFRPGRFEMPLGNGKLVGLRDGLNVRYTFQGVRATYLLPGKISIDAFAVRPVNAKPDEFDDGPNHAVVFHGVYMSAPNRVLGFGTDVYWYESNRDRAILREGAGKDDRSNWGARLWRRNATWDFDLEGNYQSGQFANKNIRAYAVLFEGGYTFGDLSLAPRVGLRANVFSGDGNLSDTKAGTFVSAYPRFPVMSEAAFFNLSNLMTLYPSVTVKPSKSIVLVVGPDFLWRNRRQDGVYIGPIGASFAPYASSRFIGTELNLDASWQATKRLQLRLFETYFDASGSFSTNGGRNGNYFGLQAGYRI